MLAAVASTVRVVLVVSLWPVLSVTVRLTVTLPTALVTKLAVGALTALLKLAMVPPPVIVHW